MVIQINRTVAGVKLRRSIKSRYNWIGIIAGQGVEFIPGWDRPRMMMWEAVWRRYPGAFPITLAYGSRLSVCIRNTRERLIHVHGVTTS